MKVQFEAKTYITFSFDVPQKYEQLISAEIEDLSVEEIDKRSDYYDKMCILAKEKIYNDFKDSFIDNINIDEIWSDEIF